MKSVITVILIGCCLLAVGLLTDVASNSSVFPITEAEARVGRPRTPVSVAGVARRTSRRVIRRSSSYAPTLPGGCSTVIVEGTTLYLCGGSYYQPYNNQYVIVYID